MFGKDNERTKLQVVLTRQRRQLRKSDNPSAVGVLYDCKALWLDAQGVHTAMEEWR